MSRFGPRDSLRQPFEGYPAYGALHPAIPNQQLREFYFDQTRIADYFIVNRLAGVQVEPLTFDPEIDGVENPLVIEERAREAVIDTYNPNRFYRMFNPDTLGVTVVEMDGSSRVANRMRVVWESQDFGAVEQEAVNEIGRTLPNIVPRLIFNGARGAGGRLPNVPNTEVRQKMALMPDQNQHQATQKLLVNFKNNGIKILDLFFRDHKGLMIAYDIAAIGLVVGGVLLFGSATKQIWQTILIASVFIGVGIFLSNRKRTTRIVAFFKKRSNNKH